MLAPDLPPGAALTNVNLIYCECATVPIGQRVAAMVRYFFHVFCDGDMHVDENGQDFSDLKGAKARAATIARELAEDGYCVGSVCIFDEKGNELDRVPIGADVTGGD
jgi:hypothetical protein